MMFLDASLSISNNEAEAKGYDHCCNFTYSWSLVIGGVKGESEDKSHKSVTTKRKCLLPTRGHPHCINLGGQRLIGSLAECKNMHKTFCNNSMRVRDVV